MNKNKKDLVEATATVVMRRIHEKEKSTLQVYYYALLHQSRKTIVTESGNILTEKLSQTNLVCTKQRAFAYRSFLTQQQLFDRKGELWFIRNTSKHNQPKTKHFLERERNKNGTKERLELK